MCHSLIVGVISTIFSSFLGRNKRGQQHGATHILYNDQWRKRQTETLVDAEIFLLIRVSICALFVVYTFMLCTCEPNPFSSSSVLGGIHIHLNIFFFQTTYIWRQMLQKEAKIISEERIVFHSLRSNQIWSYSRSVKKGGKKEGNFFSTRPFRHWSGFLSILLP